MRANELFRRTVPLAIASTLALAPARAQGRGAQFTHADTLRGSFRKVDIVGRYGGEEFVIAMPDTNTDTAIQKLERLRQAIADTPMSITKDGVSAAVTISAGLAGFPDDGREEEQLLSAADGRLFRAKATGRNRIVR